MSKPIRNKGIKPEINKQVKANAEIEGCVKYTSWASYSDSRLLPLFQSTPRVGTTLEYQSMWNDLESQGNIKYKSMPERLLSGNYQPNGPLYINVTFHAQDFIQK